MDRASTPVILLAFADPRGDLANLKAESNGIREIFWRFDDLIEIIVLDHPSFDQIIGTFQRYRNRIVAFHYGGHATGFELLLETTAGGELGIGAEGLAEFLGSRRGLEFVFLNGCSTRQQVDGFLDAGVKCVIATTQAIDDREATEFSKHFYNALATDSDLGEAFNEASAATKSGRGGNTRALTAKRKRKQANDDSLPWQQHVRDEKALAWTFQWEARRRRRNVRGADARETASLRKLQALLEKVQEDWIDTVLRDSTHDGTLIDLTLEPKPNKVADRWGHVEQGDASPDRATDYAHRGDRIIDVFDDTEQTLLILGPPGSGKTTTLLQLAESLLDRARSETDQSVPVFLHLSSWDGSLPSFEDWVAGELGLRYFVAENLARRWLENSQLILLLDGLDEVPEHLRQRCVQSLQDFMSRSDVPGVTVCCDDGEYDASHLKLRLGGAVLLQPLTDQQIASRLAVDSSGSQALRELMKRYDVLESLVHSPLMLNIMCQAFDAGEKNVDVDENMIDSSEKCRSLIFDRFIDRMFSRRQNAEPDFGPQPTARWLTELANHHDDDGSAIIQVERLQPDPMLSGGSRVAYTGILSVIIGVCTALFATILFLALQPVSTNVRECVDNGLVYWFTPCYLIWFILLTLVDKPIHSEKDSGGDFNRLAKQGAWKAAVFYALWFVVAVAPALAIADGLVVALIAMSGVIPSVAFGAYGCNRCIVHSIKSVEALAYDRRYLIRGAFFGWVAALGLWLILYSVWGEINLHFAWQTDLSESTSYGRLIFLMIFSVVGIQVGAIVGGLVPTAVEGKTQINQGMRLSVSNSLKAGLTSGIVVFVSVLAFLVIVHERTLATEWPIALASGLMTAYGIGLWYGGFELIKHVVLRCILAATGKLPLPLGRFLAHGGKLKFLHRAGGGYLFVHPLLREHFATKRE